MKVVTWYTSLLRITQSGFKPSDSSVNQFISITHSIFSTLDASASLELFGVFLILSKSFRRVWHEGLIYEIRNNRINGNHLDLIESFLENRHQ